MHYDEQRRKQAEYYEQYQPVFHKDPIVEAIESILKEIAELRNEIESLREFISENQ